MFSLFQCVACCHVHCTIKVYVLYDLAVYIELSIKSTNKISNNELTIILLSSFSTTIIQHMLNKEQYFIIYFIYTLYCLFIYMMTQTVVFSILLIINKVYFNNNTCSNTCSNNHIITVFQLPEENTECP